MSSRKSASPQIQEDPVDLAAHLRDHSVEGKEFQPRHDTELARALRLLIDQEVRINFITDRHDLDYGTILGVIDHPSGPWLIMASNDRSDDFSDGELIPVASIARINVQTGGKGSFIKKFAKQCLDL